MIQSRVHSYGLYRLLEQRFDGEMPEHLRRLTLAGGRTALEEALAQANSRCCDALALSAVRAAAARRAGAWTSNVWRRESLAWRARTLQHDQRVSSEIPFHTLPQSL